MSGICLTTYGYQTEINVAALRGGDVGVIHPAADWGSVGEVYRALGGGAAETAWTQQKSIHEIENFDSK